MSVTVISVLLSVLAMAAGTVLVYTQDTPASVINEFVDRPASFGEELPLDGLRGFLVAGSPIDGCSTLAAPPPTENFTGKWIVIVQRYNCSFEVKVRNAQAVGYDSVIVHNVNSSDLETMSAAHPEGIIIPSVFVAEDPGHLLINNYQYHSGYYIMVNGDIPIDINTHLLLPFAVVVVLCLLVILIFMIVKCIKDRRRARRHRLPNRSLKKIPTCKFGKGDPYDTCAICLDDYQEGDRLRVLPCAHAYHAACIDPWLTQNKRVCPVCKRRVVAAGERVRRDLSDSDSDTEPLLAAPAPAGGTFEEQQENPFVRASRYISRLRARQQDSSNNEVATSPEDNEQTVNDENVDDDAEPLIRGSRERGEGVTAGTVSERAPRRTRQRRARPPRRPPGGVGGAGGTGGRRARSAEQAPVASPPHDTHSINNETTGEIGVAALPVSHSTPIARHINL